MGVYVVERWSALQLFGYCHKAQCLITNKLWFNQRSECFRMDRLQLSFSLGVRWGGWPCRNNNLMFVYKRGHDSNVWL